MRTKLVLVSFTLAILFSLSTNASYSKEVPKNQFIKGVSELCKTNTQGCTSEIFSEDNAAELQACVNCCGLDEVFQLGQKCFNSCICECSLKSNPSGENTKKLCSKRKKNKSSSH